MYESEHRLNINKRLSKCGYDKISTTMDKETFIKFGDNHNTKLHVYYRNRNKTNFVVCIFQNIHLIYNYRKEVIK